MRSRSFLDERSSKKSATLILMAKRRQTVQIFAAVALAFGVFSANFSAFADEPTPSSAFQAIKTVVAPSLESATPSDPIRFEKSDAAFLSDGWLADFAVPPRVFRPLQIVHGRDLTDPKTVAYYRDDCGLGGLVVNVGGAGYVREAANWKRFVDGLQNLKDGGMRAWIYDEDGYPSLSAGGVVLEGFPELASLELAFDPERDPPIYVRDCYEFTHSSNNVCAARRYPNPLNPAATERFLDVTHRRYKAELSPELYDYVEAFFTDEPSLQAVNLGEIQDDIRVNVPTVDPLDPNKKALPVVPWGDDLEARYAEKYGEELAPNFQSLFAGSSDADRRVRRQFWSLVAELNAERFYGAIRNFCRENEGGPVASGHTLYEENLIIHVPIDGNKIAALKMFDLPGLDMLNSDPVAYFWGCWLAAAFPCSAAEFVGSRKVMTEICDFSQLHSGDRKAVDLATMEAAAAWQAAFGVTEFTLYYGINGGENAPYRNEGSHRDYCRYVGRLNAALRDASPVRPVLLYYPIEEMQEEYLPVAQKLELSTQSERARQLYESFNLIGEGLTRAQISFYVVDRSTLRSLTKNPENAEEAARLLGKFSAIVFPRHSERLEYDWADSAMKEIWVDDAEKTIARWEDVGAVVEALGDAAGPRFRPAPETPNPSLIEGAFEREGRLVFVLSNPLLESWSGKVRLAGRLPSADADLEFASNEWTRLDPKTGAVETFELSDGAVSLDFAGRQTYILVSPKTNGAK